MPHPSDGGRTDGEGVRPLAAWTIVLLLAALDAAPFFVAFVEGDFARDLYAALRIVQGRAFPLEGPVISGATHLGPAWYYTLAIPMALGRSVTAVVATIAVLAALRFPLAFLVGREAFDARTGLAFAILLALPGVGSLASLWIAHPSVAPTLVLAVLWSLWRAQARSSPGWLAAAGAAFGLALHAHPTTLPLAIPLAWVAAGQVRRDGARGLAAALAALALAAAPFLPLAAGWREHVASVLDLSARMSNDAAAIGAGTFAAVAENLAWRVPDQAVATWIAVDGRALVVWRAYAAVLYAAAMAGAVLAIARGEPRERQSMLLVAASLVAWFLFITAIRGVTRFYMLYAVLPALALLLALGVTALARHAGRAGDVVARTMLAGALAWAIAVPAARVARALDDDLRLPPIFAAHGDLRQTGAVPYVRLHYLSARHLDLLGRRLCVDGVVHAFGDLAQVVDSQFNVPAQLRCGDRSRVVIGGTPAAGDHAFFLVQRGALEPRAALRDFGGFGFGRVEDVLVEAPSIPLARGEDYPSRKGCDSPAPHAFEFTTQRAATLVVASGLPITCPMRVLGLERDGVPVEPGAAGEAAWTRTPGAPARWRLVVETGAPESIQVFTVAPPRDARRP